MPQSLAHTPLLGLPPDREGAEQAQIHRDWEIHDDLGNAGRGYGPLQRSSLEAQRGASLLIAKLAGVEIE